MTVPLEGKDSNIVISGNRWEYYNARGISVTRAIWFVCSENY